jgi:acyl-ACP thioesterase
MENIYSKNYLTTYADVDYKRIVKPSSILNFFQCVAGEHASLLGVGSENLEKIGIFWVLSKIYYKVIKPIKVDQTVTVTTWPLQSGKIICDRDFLITDTISGDLLIKATSKWCVLDRKTHRPMPTKLLNFDLSAFKTERALDYNIPQIKIDANFNKTDEKNIDIDYTDLDFNMHVNNIKYADFVMRLFTAEEMAEKTVSDFEINYIKECREGEQIKLERHETNDKYIITGKSEDKDAFSCQISLRNEKSI